MPGNFISTPWKFYFHAWYFDPVTLIYFHAEKKYFHAEKNYFHAEKKYFRAEKKYGNNRQQINPNPQYFVPLMDTNLH